MQRLFTVPGPRFAPGTGVQAAHSQVDAKRAAPRGECRAQAHQRRERPCGRQVDVVEGADAQGPTRVGSGHRKAPRVLILGTEENGESSHKGPGTVLRNRRISELRRYTWKSVPRSTLRVSILISTLPNTIPPSNKPHPVQRYGRRASAWNLKPPHLCGGWRKGKGPQNEQCSPLR